MNIIKSHLPSALCFITMPALMLFVITGVHCGFLTPETQIPGWIEWILNWRISATTFLVTLLVGIAVCSTITIFSIRQNAPITKGSLKKAYDIAVKFVANNFYFWGGLLLANTFGSRALDFIQPIQYQGVMVLLFIISGGAIEFLLKFWNREILQDSLTQ